MTKGADMSERVTLDEGTYNGVRTLLHFEGDQLIVEKQIDREAVLAHVREMRERNALRGFGVPKEIGHVLELDRPELELVKRTQGAEAARRWMKAYFKQHSDLCAWPAFLQ